MKMLISASPDRPIVGVGNGIIDCLFFYHFGHQNRTKSLSEKPVLGFNRLQSVFPALLCIALSLRIRLLRAPWPRRFRSVSGRRETSRIDSQLTIEFFGSLQTAIN